MNPRINDLRIMAWSFVVDDAFSALFLIFIKESLPSTLRVLRFKNKQV